MNIRKLKRKKISKKEHKRGPSTINGSASQYDAAVELRRAGLFQKSAEILREIIRQKPDDSRALRLLGLVMHDLREPHEAIAILEKALANKKYRQACYLDIATIYFSLCEYNYAIKYFERALEYSEENQQKNIYLHLAKAYQEAGKPQRAIEIYRLLLKDDDQNLLLYRQLGIALREDGQIDESVNSFKKALELNPEDAESFFHLVSTRHETGLVELVPKMKKLLQRHSLSLKDKEYISFALGAVNHRFEKYEESFRCYDFAKKIRKEKISYRIEEDKVYFDRIKNVFTRDLIDKLSKSSSHLQQEKTPIFIVGMPRSGTTLVEQILSSHPAVEGLGELKYLRLAIERKRPEVKYLSYPEDVINLKNSEFTELGLNYLQQVTRNFEVNTPFFTDKMPWNYMHLGMIKIILPQAKIIHCTRNPVATCFSCYTTFFETLFPAFLDLESLGNYYLLYDDLMRYWQEALPDFILDVRYEDVVDNLEPQVKRILDFCDLDFDSGCLKFHKENRVVKTASVTQVRRPVYSSSKNQWTNYEQQLRPLTRILERH